MFTAMVPPFTTVWLPVAVITGPPCSAGGAPGCIRAVASVVDADVAKSVSVSADELEGVRGDESCPQPAATAASAHTSDKNRRRIKVPWEGTTGLSHRVPPAQCGV